MLLVLLCACRSGVIHFATGSDDLRAAWFATDPAYTQNLSQTVVLLANSSVDCDTIPSLDATKEDLAVPADAAILTRENARVVILFLFQQAGESLESTYVVEPERDGENVTTENGVASAAYLGVNEAVLIDEDGLNRFYLPGSNPGDCELVDHVPSPGEVVIAHAGTHLKGTFSLDAIDVSGHFDAKECSTNPDFVTTLQSVAVLRQNLSMCVDDPTAKP
jgi:hypothetical protein